MDGPAASDDGHGGDAHQGVGHEDASSGRYHPFPRAKRLLNPCQGDCRTVGIAAEVGVASTAGDWALSSCLESCCYYCCSTAMLMWGWLETLVVFDMM
jgi:hypothetical protein